MFRFSQGEKFLHQVKEEALTKKMDAGNEVFTANSNVGSRAESVQVSNVGASRNWYTETIFSRNRDRGLYKFPSKYTVPLSRNYKRVLEVELLNAEFPRSIYVIEAQNAKLGSSGNNSFRFGEGYIIDDGSVYGICNDRLVINEVDPCSCIMSEHVTYFPRTLSRTFSISIESVRDKRVCVTTCTLHNLTSKHTPILWLLDGDPVNGFNINGKYKLEGVVDHCSFLAVACDCDGPNFCPIDETLSQDGNSVDDLSIQVLQEREKTTPYLYIPRVPSPSALAELVQDYLNNRAEPPLCNKYSVTFNGETGKFAFDRAAGQAEFDVLACGDERSIFPTLGFAGVDYRFGSWSAQNLQRTVLPSDMMDFQVRPTILSETVGESALVCITEGNYLPQSLAATITQEMQRPLVYAGENDTLTIQLLGQQVTITVPCGMYTPNNLADAIATEMTCIYHKLSGEACEQFQGEYDLEHGAYSFRSCHGAVFGLLFAQSTIGPLLGFDNVNLIGSCFYTSMRPVFVPVTNNRYTSSIYNVSAQLDQQTFRFLKAGQYQAPIVKLTTKGSDVIYVHTWTREKGGGAHGFQVGDLVRLEGPCQGIRTTPQFIGVHVVENVINAFVFQIRGSLERYVDPQEGDDDNDEESNDVNVKGEKKKCTKMSYVASHWFEPFFLQFPGVPNTISQVVGFPEARSGCLDYVSSVLWNMFRRCEIFLNIQNVADNSYGRIYKTSDSGKQTKYQYETLNSFVRVPLTLGADFGLLQASSYTRSKRFLFNSVDFADLSVTIVDAAGDLVNFNGVDHCFDLRFYTEQ